MTGTGDTLSTASQDQDRNLRNLLERSQERNIQLNRDKFTFKCYQAPFMPKPEDVQAVRRFVNAVKYLWRFLEDLSEPLRRLADKHVAWEWPQE